MEQILVLGATGSTGRRLTARLRAEGHEVRAASRQGEIHFDWTDPGTWQSAIGEATRMYLMAPDGVAVEPEFVATAVGLGVHRIVLLSSMGIEAMGDERLMAAERTVHDCGADWTILRANWFDQNFDEGFLFGQVMAGTVILPLGDFRQAFVDAGDLAGVAAAALIRPGHEGRTYDVTGPEALTFGEAVDLLAKATGRPLRFLGSAEDFRADQDRLGTPSAATEAAIGAWASLRAQGDDVPNDNVLRFTGQEPKTFAAYAAEAGARGAWALPADEPWS